MLIKLKKYLFPKNEKGFLKYFKMLERDEKLPENIQVSLGPTPNGGAFAVCITGYTFMEIHECDKKGNSIYRTYSIVNLLKYANMKRSGEKLPEGVRVYLKPLLHDGDFFVVISGGFPTKVHECDEKGNRIYTIHAADFWNYANMKRENESLPENVQVCIESTLNTGNFSVAFKNRKQTTIFECDARGNCILIK